MTTGTVRWNHNTPYYHIEQDVNIEVNVGTRLDALIQLKERTPPVSGYTVVGIKSYELIWEEAIDPADVNFSHASGFTYVESDALENGFTQSHDYGSIHNSITNVGLSVYAPAEPGEYILTANVYYWDRQGYSTFLVRPYVESNSIYYTVRAPVVHEWKVGAEDRGEFAGVEWVNDAAAPTTYQDIYGYPGNWTYEEVRHESSELGFHAKVQNTSANIKPQVYAVNIIEGYYSHGLWADGTAYEKEFTEQNYTPLYDNLFAAEDAEDIPVSTTKWVLNDQHPLARDLPRMEALLVTSDPGSYKLNSVEFRADFSTYLVTQGTWKVASFVPGVPIGVSVIPWHFKSSTDYTSGTNPLVFTSKVSAGSGHAAFSSIPAAAAWQASGTNGYYFIRPDDDKGSIVKQWSSTTYFTGTFGDAPPEYADQPSQSILWFLNEQDLDDFANSLAVEWVALAKRKN